MTIEELRPFKIFENGEFKEVDELYNPNDHFFCAQGWYHDGEFWEAMPNRLFVVNIDNVPIVVSLSYDGEKLYDYNSQFQYTHVANPVTHTLYPVKDIEEVMTDYLFNHPCYKNIGIYKFICFAGETKNGYLYIRRDDYEQIINNGLFELRQQKK